MNRSPARSPSPLAAALLLAAACASCAPRHLQVQFHTAELSRDERRTIERIADATVPEVRRLLPGLPRRLLLKVNTGTAAEVIPETGETGTALAPGTVYWTVDSSRPEGVAAIARRQLRATLVHELHHLVRDARVPRRSLLDHVVAEGMATAFERDLAGTAPPWGRYPPEVTGWLRELLALPGTAPRRPWMFRHPDGRRWIGYKVGTYLVDRASAASGKTSAGLVAMPSADLIRLARPR